MKRLLPYILVLGVIGLGFVYPHSICLQAWIWHLRHGTSLVVGNYIIPIPKNWYPVSPGPFLVRLDTDDSTPSQKPKMHASIEFNARQQSDQELRLKEALDMDLLKKHHVEPIIHRTFNLRGTDLMSCVGGSNAIENAGFARDIESWECNSSELQVGILAAKPDMEQVWVIMAGIQIK